MLVTLGLALDIFLILSRLNHFFRILCVVLWWPGVTVVAAASRWGVCLLLHFRNVRHVRPWELIIDDGVDTTSDTSDAAENGDFHKHMRKETAASVATTVSSRGPDPLRKPSLQTFGPKNEPDSEPWAKMHACKTVYGKIFDEALTVQNQSLQLMQDRAVFLAIVWGALAASVLAIGSLFVPGGGVFL
jgi:hypothetical protein